MRNRAQVSQHNSITRATELAGSTSGSTGADALQLERDSAREGQLDGHDLARVAIDWLLEERLDVAAWRV